jgi:hypothetical protein
MIRQRIIDPINPLPYYSVNPFEEQPITTESTCPCLVPSYNPFR